jgi:hypothetical protein
LPSAEQGHSAKHFPKKKIKALPSAEQGALGKAFPKKKLELSECRAWGTRQSMFQK